MIWPMNFRMGYLIPELINEFMKLTLLQGESVSGNKIQIIAFPIATMSDSSVAVAAQLGTWVYISIRLHAL